MEVLLACAILIDNDLMTNKEYNQYLDELFVKTPDNSLLIELEWCSSNIKQSIIIIKRYFVEQRINYNKFGMFLLSKLEKVYQSNKMNIKDFGERMYLLWKSLPPYIQDVEPFHILSYADEPLSWGDEKQTREIYEYMFNSYNG